MNKISIAHIINPFTVNEDSDLFVAQPVTFETMRAAKEAAVKDVEVELFAAFFPEDEKIVSAYFTKTTPLKRSILNIGKFKSKRKLPLLKDILDRLYEKSDADYFIYTNVDIALTPGFYTEIEKIIAKGVDGFVINRRTISNTYTRVEDIPKMIAEAKKGDKHPGYDCFIFKRSAYQNYRLDTACVGANWIGRILIANIMAFSDTFKIFEDKHLTFHIGDDRAWLNPGHSDLNHHNEDLLLKIFEELIAAGNAKNKETLREFHMYNLKIRNPHPSMLVEIVTRNSPVCRLPGKPGDIYHSEFRHSTTWEHFEDQRIRQDPIFIVGYPRSGTTLVQALIATQETIVSFYETHFFSLVRRVIHVENDRLLGHCIDMVVEKIRERIAFSKNAETYIKKLAQGTGLSVKMLFETIVIDTLINKVGLEKMGALRWMEKTPDHVMHLDVIARFYPSAKIIYVMRNPEKSILSRRRHFTFNDEAGWPVEAHVQKWLAGVRVMETFKKNNPGSLVVVRLEDITMDTAGEMRKICEFLDISFDPDRLKNRKEIAKELLYPWENWKKGAAQDISPEIAVRKESRFSSADKIKLYMMAGKEMKTYGYYSTIKSVIDFADRVPRAGVWRMKRLYGKCRGKFTDSILPLFKTYPGKVNLSEQLRHFYGRHRSGWIYAVACLKPLHNPKGTYFDAFIERTFAWNAGGPKPHTQPWVGFIHVPPNVPDWFQSQQANQNIFKTKAWLKSIPLCKGLFTLSMYHRKYLESKLDVPVNNLFFPTEIPDLKWSWERFQANKDKKIVQVGWWLRRIHSIFQLQAQKYRKLFLKINYFNWDYLILKEREILIKEGAFTDEMYDTAETVLFMPDEDYDRLLAENIVFLHLYDSSANNTVIECIVRNTPLLINPLESVVEYLGKDYPFYFETLAEAAAKVEDEELINKTYRYLLDHPLKEKLTGDYFAESFAASEIYRNLKDRI